MSAAMPYPNGDAMLDEVADRIASATGHAAKRSGNGYALRCPAHDDRSPSLSMHLSDDGGRVLLRCHTGCDWRDVIAAVGLSDRDLFVNRGSGDSPRGKVVPLRPQTTERAKPAKPNTEAERETGAARAKWDAYRETEAAEACATQAWDVTALDTLHRSGDVAGPSPRRGTEWEGRLRLAYRDADGVPTGFADRATLPRHTDVPDPMKVWAKGTRNLWPRVESIPEGSPVAVIVEGEADALALWSIGIPAVGVPGAQAWKPGWAERFARFDRVLVITDADTDGRTLAGEAARDLAAHGVRVTIGDPFPDRTDGSDIRDLLRSGVKVSSVTGLEKALTPIPAPTPAEPTADDEQDANAIQPFQVWTVDEMMAWPEPDPLIHGVLTVGDRFGIVAPFSSGKSAVALDMALRIAAGLPWQGREVTRGGVIYVAAENAYGFPKRIKAWGLRNGVDPSTLPFLLIRDSMKLNGARMDDLRLLETVRSAQARWDVPVRVVYLDTVRRTLDGKENESHVFQAYVDACDRIGTETGAAVGLVHHSPKSEDSQGGRGSGVWNDALAPILSLKAKGEAGSVTVDLTCAEKRGGKPPKDLEPFADMAFHLVGVRTGDTDRYGAPLSGVVAVEGAHPKATQDEADRRADLILDAIRQDGPRTRPALVTMLGGRKQVALDAIRDLEERGLIVVTGRHGKADLLGLPPEQTALDAD